eukprot:14425040-Alexandrium_andersonii.AAC.1
MAVLVRASRRARACTLALCCPLARRACVRCVRCVRVCWGDGVSASPRLGVPSGCLHLRSARLWPAWSWAPF